MVEVGSRIPDAKVWTSPGESTMLAELAAGRPALFLFYLFDFSAT